LRRSAPLSAAGRRRQSVSKALAPPYLPSTRLPFERHVFRVIATVYSIRPEGDGDFHVLLRDRPYEMISEAPSPACNTAAPRPLQRAMAAARRASESVGERASPA
jgi:hypothetical protein